MKRSKKGRVHKRYWFKCQGCGNLKLFREWSWKWDDALERKCDCGAVLKRCSDKESAAANKLYPKYKRNRKRDAYADYLSSALWQKIRSRVLERDRRTCPCGSAAVEVHHMAYNDDVMLGQNDNFLIALCHPCHDFITYRADGSKRGRAETARLLEAIKRDRRPAW